MFYFQCVPHDSPKPQRWWLYCRGWSLSIQCFHVYQPPHPAFSTYSQYCLNTFTMLLLIFWYLRPRKKIVYNTSIWESPNIFYWPQPWTNSVLLLESSGHCTIQKRPVRLYYHCWARWEDRAVTGDVWVGRRVNSPQQKGPGTQTNFLIHP